jgi:hypothetical protein
MPPYDRVRQRVQTPSGITALKDDIRIDTCAAFAGPSAELKSCLATSQTNLRAPGSYVQRSLSLGPQAQARWNHPGIDEEVLYG